MLRFSKKIVITFKIVFFVPTFILILFSPVNASLSPQLTFQQDALKLANNAIGRNIGDYTLTDQNGKSFGLKELKGKPFIISFIYTDCGHICPTITMNLGKAIKEAGRDFGSKFHALTIGFDVEKDTPQRMNEYGRSFTSDFKNWRFATSDKDTIGRITNDFGFYYKKIQGGFDHLNVITIVDAKGRIYKHVYGLDVTHKEILDPIYKSMQTGGGELLNNEYSGLDWSDVLNKIKLFCYTYDESTGTYKLSYALLIERLIEIIIIFLIVLYMWKKEIRSLFSRLFSKGHAQ